MATRKKTPAKKRSSKALSTKSMADWEKDLEKYATETSAKEVTQGGSYISIKKNKFTYQEQNIGTEMSVILIGFAHERSYYDVPYDADNPTTPACFRIDLDGKGEGPNEVSPVAQSETCEDCWANEWASAKTGRGKACGEHRRLAMIDGTVENADQVMEAEMAFMKVPPTSLKNWKGYVKKLEKGLKRPPFAVVTRVSFDEDAEWETLEFELVEQISDPELLEAIVARIDEANETLCAEYDASGYSGGPRKAAAKKKAPARKKAGAKKKAPAKKKATAKKRKF